MAKMRAMVVPKVALSPCPIRRSPDRRRCRGHGPARRRNLWRTICLHGVGGEISRDREGRPATPGVIQGNCRCSEAEYCAEHGVGPHDDLLTVVLRREKR